MVLLLLCGLAVFNVCDVLLTLRGISLGRLREGNVLMSALLQASTTLAIAVKMSLVGIGSLILWRLRNRRLVFWSIVVLTCWFAAVVLYNAILLFICL